MGIIIMLILGLVALWTFNRYKLKPMLNKQYNPKEEVLNPNSSMRLITFNTFGLDKFGEFRKNGNTFVTYQCFTFFFLPIFPFGCYRIEVFDDDQYKVYGSVKISLLEILSIYLNYYTWFFIIILAILGVCSC